MKRVFPIAILFTLLIACSKGDGVDDYPPVNTPEDSTHQNDSTIDYGPIKASYHFDGIWMIDEIMGDTLEARLTVRGEDKYCFISFYGLPYESIMKKVSPETKVKWIDQIFRGWQAIGKLWDEIYKRCSIDEIIKPYDERPFRCIGLSDNAVYMELMESEKYGKRHLPFIVIDKNENLMGVILTITPTESIAVMDRNGASLSCVLSVTQIETIVNGESQIKNLNPAMQLKYTGAKK